MGKDTFKAEIRKKDGMLWEGEVTSLSSKNEVGVFDVLPEHSHFVSTITEYVIVRPAGGEKRIELAKGILQVKDGVARVFVGV